MPRECFGGPPTRIGEFRIPWRPRTSACYVLRESEANVGHFLTKTDEKILKFETLKGFRGLKLAYRLRNHCFKQQKGKSARRH